MGSPDILNDVLHRVLRCRRIAASSQRLSDMGRNYDHLGKDELVALLQARDRRDATKFGLVWEADEIEREKAINSDFVALDLDPGLSSGVAPWRNLIIEGDNFDALRHLNMTFKGRVKCIYIDPPYNTGNKDFVYNDHFVEKEDLWRHSTWCEFMFQRLTLAKDLLREDGVIFVSIDDNELFHLGLLMDKVFGAGNFVANIVWQKRTSPDARLNLGAAHDYVLAYANALSALKPTLNKIPLSGKRTGDFKNPDNDSRGVWASVDLTGQTGHATPEQFFIIETPSRKKLSPPPGRCWALSEKTFKNLVKENRIWFGKNGDSRPRIKKFLSESEGSTTWTWWTNEEVGHNQEGTKELNDVMSGSDIFSNPKPTRLIERILQIATNPGDLILDFFAGSGTTAHAVQKMNKADCGNRRFILVSSTEATEDAPDKNLCRDVCAERVRRVITGYRNAKGEDVEGLGGDFAYLRCRKIASSRLLDIEHEQVWTALQLIHRPHLLPYVEAPFLMAEGGEDAALIYIPRFEKSILPRLREAVRRHASVIIYSWQPGLLRQHLRADHVQHEAIPESLVRRFGLKK